VSVWTTSRPEIVDADEAGAAQGFVDQLRTLKKDLAAAQKVELAPHEVAAAEVKAKYRSPLDSIELALKALLEKSGAWILRERFRVAAEKAAQEAEAKRLRDEAARLEREAQEAARVAGAVAEEAELAARRATETAKLAEKAAEKKPEKVTIKGDGAPRAMTLRAYWRAEVVDEAEALKSYAGNPIVRKACLDAALQLANELARNSKSEGAAPAGFRFIKEERAS
jgi:hypothetical protein